MPVSADQTLVSWNVDQSKEDMNQALVKLQGVCVRGCKVKVTVARTRAPPEHDPGHEPDEKRQRREAETVKVRNCGSVLSARKEFMASVGRQHKRHRHANVAARL